MAHGDRDPDSSIYEFEELASVKNSTPELLRAGRINASRTTRQTRSQSRAMAGKSTNPEMEEVPDKPSVTQHRPQSQVMSERASHTMSAQPPQSEGGRPDTPQKFGNNAATWEYLAWMHDESDKRDQIIENNFQSLMESSATREEMDNLTKEVTGVRGDIAKMNSRFDDVLLAFDHTTTRLGNFMRNNSLSDEQIINAPIGSPTPAPKAVTPVQPAAGSPQISRPPSRQVPRQPTRIITPLVMPARGVNIKDLQERFNDIRKSPDRPTVPANEFDVRKRIVIPPESEASVSNFYRTVNLPENDPLKHTGFGFPPFGRQPPNTPMPAGVHFNNRPTTESSPFRYAANLNMDGPTQHPTSYQFNNTGGGTQDKGKQKEGNERPMAGATGPGGDPDGSDSSDSYHSGDPRRPSRVPMPRQDPPPRQRSFTPGVSNQHTSTSESSSKLKRADVGQFDPGRDDPDDVGMIAEGDKIVFTDVYSFVERIDTFLEDEDTCDANARQILGLFQTLLGGPALMWWNNELTSQERMRLRTRGLSTLLDNLIDRFSMQTAVATERFNSSSLTLKDMARDEAAMITFIQKKLRYARAMKTLSRNNRNWHGVMTAIWSSMDLGIKSFLPAPVERGGKDRGNSLADYMTEVARAKPVLLAAAREKFPWASRDSRRKHDRYGRSTSPKYRKTRNKYSDRRGRRDRYDDDQRNRRDRYEDDRRNRGRSKERRSRGRKESREPAWKRKGERRKASREGRQDKYKQEQRVHIAGDDASEENRQSASDSGNNDSSSDDSDSAYIMIDYSVTCEYCDKTFDSSRQRDKHAYLCENQPPEGITVLFPGRESNRRCKSCGESFASRNKLFNHLDACPNKDEDPKPQQHPVDAAFVARKDETSENVPGDNHVIPTVRKAPPKLYEVGKVADKSLNNFSYLKAVVRSEVGGQDQMVCLDTGAGRSLVTRKFLESVVHTIEEKRGRVKGIGKGRVKCSHWAEFTFYLLGRNGEGHPELMEVTEGAWVFEEDIEPMLLLGNNFLDPRGVTIDYENHKITMANASDFEIPFRVYPRAHPCVRKVTLQQNVRLEPGVTVHAPAVYKPLPSDRDFTFEPSHVNGVACVVRSTTPHSVVLSNLSPDTTIIIRGTKVGTIQEMSGTDFTPATWKGCVKAVMVAAGLTALAKLGVGAAATVPAPGNSEGVGLHLPNDFNIPESFCMKDGFSNTPILGAIATESYVPTPPVSEESSAYLGEIATVIDSLEACGELQGTPLTDAVYNMVETSSHMPVTKDMMKPTEEEQPKPRIQEVAATLGIKKSSEQKEMVAPGGQSIYTGGDLPAQKILDLLEEIPEIWTDQGIIDIPEDEQMKVPLVDNWQETKLNSRAYPLSIRDRQAVDLVFDKLHKQGRMEWVDGPSPFAHPAFVVWLQRKGEPYSRPVIDLRVLNKVAVPDNYPLPLQSEVISSIRGKKYVSVVDATSFFYQFGVHPDYRDRFTIITPRGMERSTVALMGFRNSPAYVQRFMDKLLRKFRSFCRAFIDDIVIFSDTWKEHLEQLRTIFQLFKKRRISLSPKKSFLGYPSVDLLGFRVDAFGMSTTAERLAAFKNLRFPNQLRALEQYLGSSGFLRTLLPYYARCAEPLQRRKVALLNEGRKTGQIVAKNPGKRQAYVRSTVFEPTAEELASFEAVQNLICSNTTIHHHDPSKTLFMQVDGSLERGFGVMMFHLRDGYVWTPGDYIPNTQVLPVMFLSRCVARGELRYGPSELEVACVVWTCKRLRTMIEASEKPVVVLTDHSSTKGIMDQTSLNTSSTDRANKRLVNASIYLSQYGLQVYHVPGRLNFVPDALSRLLSTLDELDENGKIKRSDEEPVLDQIWLSSEAVMDESLRKEIIADYQKDTKYRKILEEIRKDNEDVADFTRPGYPFAIVGNLLYNVDRQGRYRLCVPKAQIGKFLAIAHDDKHHFGRRRMMEELEPYAIESKTRKVSKYIEYCNGCRTCETRREKPYGDYEPIRPSDTRPMKTIAIDFILALPRVPSINTPWQMEGHEYYDVMMTGTCATSKRSLLIPGNKKYTAEEWGASFARQILLCDWGVPTGIISDRDRKFTSDFWKGLWKSLGARLLMTTAYHPQGDGLSERKNQTVEIALRHFLFQYPERPWSDLIPALQWNLNSAYSEATKSSAHEQLFGFRLPGPNDVLTEADPTNALDKLRFLREHLRKDAELAMDFAASRAKRYYDARHKMIEFQEGDEVYLKLHEGYNLPGKPSKKLSQQRAGPWKVKKRIGRLAYELDLPETFGIHPVISVAHLIPGRQGEDPFHRTTPPPGPIEDDRSDIEEEGDSFEIETIMKHRVNRTRDGFDYLVKWKGYGHEDNWWRSEWQLRSAKELLSEYWDRQGGRPTMKEKEKEKEKPGDDKVPVKRGRGRPRKTA